MSMLTPSTAVNSPNRRVTFWISSSAIADGFGPFRRWRIVAKGELSAADHRLPVGHRCQPIGSGGR
jgi:hypothetical protein